MKHFFIIFSVLALFSGSIFAATLKDQIINSAYEIKKNIETLNKMDADLNPDKFEGSDEEYRKKIKDFELWADKSISQKAEKLEKLITLFIKKNGVAAYEKLLAERIPELRKIIYEAEKNEFKWQNYLKTGYYKMVYQILLFQNIYKSLEE
ncbi:MAG TPA: hypothetical protein PLD55_12295 [bacterium]|nr:hypothetical protein [bacterium]HQB11047.1 hypothetical protein [bacterium]HQM85450.1 hypothetical protein [bacterium]